MTTKSKRTLNQAKARIAKALRRQEAETQRTIESLKIAWLDLHEAFGAACENENAEALAEINREIKRVNALQELLDKELEALK